MYVAWLLAVCLLSSLLLSALCGLSQHLSVTAYIKQSKAYFREAFHEILADISMCQATQPVRDFIIAAYVRGASVGTAEHTPLEGNTAVFTKRRL